MDRGHGDGGGVVLTTMASGYAQGPSTPFGECLPLILYEYGVEIWRQLLGLGDMILSRSQNIRKA